MMQLKLNPYFDELKLSWSSQDEKTVHAAKIAVEKIAKSDDVKKYLTEKDITKGIELYRDTSLGFVLIAYSEPKDLYRVPHNHGDSWVVYCVVDGCIEMGTYSLIKSSHLIKKEKYKMYPGNIQFYFPGDIHDTKCISENVIILRFTSCDLREEEKQGRMKRFKI